MKSKIFAIVAAVAFAVALGGCSQSSAVLKDGYFTAEMQEYNNGWREFVTIYVKDGDILSVEYNAKNASGFIKSWDMAYMRNMNAVRNMYPNRYTREYARQLVESQTPDTVDAVSGASNSGVSFKMLAAAAIESSKQGSSDVVIVDTTK